MVKDDSAKARPSLFRNKSKPDEQKSMYKPRRQRQPSGSSDSNRSGITKARPQSKQQQQQQKSREQDLKRRTGPASTDIRESTKEEQETVENRKLASKAEKSMTQTKRRRPPTFVVLYNQQKVSCKFSQFPSIFWMMLYSFFLPNPGTHYFVSLKSYLV